MKSKSGSVGAISGGRHRKRRFTLVEILIVVSIIGILAAMLMPNLRNARERAREMQCMGNLRQIALGYNMYMKDYDTDAPMPPSRQFLDDMSIIYPYVKNFEIFVCPSTDTVPVSSLNDLMGITDVENLNISQTPSGNDYMVVAMDEWEDIELSGSQNNHGHGNNPYRFDPSNPGINQEAWSKFAKWYVYEKEEGKHFRGYRNVVSMKDAHYLRYGQVSSSADSDYKLFLTLTKNEEGRMVIELKELMGRGGGGGPPGGGPPGR